MQRPGASASPDDLDITTLARSVGRSFKNILLATALAGGASFLVLSLMTPKYASEATIEIVNEDPALPRPAPSAELTRPDLDNVRTQARVLQSRDLAMKVAAHLKLDTVPEFNKSASDGAIGAVLSLIGMGAPANETAEQRILGTYYKNLQVTPFKESRVIGIEAKSSDPALAAGIANTLIKAYEDDLKKRRVQVVNAPTPGLDKEIQKLEAEIQTLEAEADRERNKLREVSISSPTGANPGATLNTQQLQELNTKLNDAKSQRSEAEARAKIIRDMLQRAGQVDSSPDVLKSPVIQQLQVQKARIDRQLAELSSALLPAHPRMLQMRAEQSGFQKQMRDEAQKIVLSLENEAKIAGAREAGVKAELDRMVEKRSDVSRDTSRLRQLDADLTGKREVLSGYKKRQDDVKVTSGSKIAPITVRIIQQAMPSSDPVSPKKAFAFLVMAATALSGLAFSVAKGVLSGTRGGAPSGGLPQGGHASARRVAARETEPAPLAARTVAGAAAHSGGMTQPARGRANISGDLDDIARRLVDRANGQPGYRTLITGEEDGLDTTTQALELARRLVVTGKRVVLVDWSAAAKPISSVLSIPRTPGIRELIANEVPFENALHVIDEAGLHVIAAGKPRTESESPSEIEGIHLVLEALDESYDHVVVTAELPVAKRLFSLVDGGFDAGLLMARPSALGEPDRVEPGFLGFAAPEMDVIRFVEQNAGGMATSRLRNLRSSVAAPQH
jgi:polysaccharide biosynthesis transport protein